MTQEPVPRAHPGPRRVVVAYGRQLSGATRSELLAFLDRVEEIPVDERVAYLDNDGTMWCEKPAYVQLDFFVDALQQRVAKQASLADRPEFAAVLSGDMAEIGKAKA